MNRKDIDKALVLRAIQTYNKKQESEYSGAELFRMMQVYDKLALYLLSSPSGLQKLNIRQILYFANNEDFFHVCVLSILRKQLFKQQLNDIQFNITDVEKFQKLDDFKKSQILLRFVNNVKDIHIKIWLNLFNSSPRIHDFLYLLQNRQERFAIFTGIYLKFPGFRGIILREFDDLQRNNKLSLADKKLVYYCLSKINKANPNKHVQNIINTILPKLSLQNAYNIDKNKYMLHCALLIIIPLTLLFITSQLLTMINLLGLSVAVSLVLKLSTLRLACRFANNTFNYFNLDDLNYLQNQDALQAYSKVVLFSFASINKDNFRMDKKLNYLNNAPNSMQAVASTIERIRQKI